MKKFLFLTGILCLASANTFAIDFNPYVAAKAKYAFSRYEIKQTGVYENKFKYEDNIWGGSIAVGNTHKVATGAFRFELEYTKNADAEDKNAKVKTQAALFNVYYDLDLNTNVPVTPYAGIGLGWGRSEFKYGRRSIKENGAAMQIGVGVSYKLCERTNIDLGYRYISYGDFDKEYRIPGVSYEKYEHKPHANELLLGVRYDF